MPEITIIERKKKSNKISYEDMPVLSLFKPSLSAYEGYVYIKLSNETFYSVQLKRVYNSDEYTGFLSHIDLADCAIELSN